MKSRTLWLLGFVGFTLGLIQLVKILPDGSISMLIAGTFIKLIERTELLLLKIILLLILLGVSIYLMIKYRENNRQ